MNYQNPKPVIYSRDNHTLSRADIDPDALKILVRLDKSGFKGYLVGGGVRDLLLGKKPKDFDIATDATPNEIRALFRNSRIIGKRFKLVHIYFRGGKIIETATFRQSSQDDPSEGEMRVQDNTFGTDATDAERRDLTINALFYDIGTFSVIDYVGGVKDLQDGIVRIIGEPTTRLHEDPVRLIRTIRHAARNDFLIEDQTLAAVHKNRELIKDCVAARVFEEIKKDFLSGSSLKVLRRLKQHELLDYLLPELCGNDFNMLGAGTVPTRILKKADRLIFNGQDICLTSILAALTLGIAAPDVSLVKLQTLLKTRKEVRNLLDSMFRSIAVPRKERERVESLLIGWLELVSTPSDELSSAYLASREYVYSLENLVRLLLSQKEDDDVLAILQRATRQRSTKLVRDRKRQVSKKSSYRKRRR